MDGIYRAMQDVVAMLRDLDTALDMDRQEDEGSDGTRSAICLAGAEVRRAMSRRLATLRSRDAAAHLAHEGVGTDV